MCQAEKGPELTAPAAPEASEPETELLAEAKAAAQAIAEQLKGIQVKIPCKGGEGGKLFGSVTTKEISAALKEQFGLELDSKKLVLPDAIKSFGGYQVKAKLGYEITGELKLKIEEA